VIVDWREYLGWDEEVVQLETRVKERLGPSAVSEAVDRAHLVDPNRPMPVTWTVPNEPQAVRRLVRKLEREAPGPVRCCYEAGPCG
jgi:hypothetical protein